MIVNEDILKWCEEYTGEPFHAVLCDPPYELGFMGKKWDSTGIAFDKNTWAAISRHLYPGAHLLAFGGTRTFHRIAVAIEDAGFEIRDTVMWVYAQGFPKSHNISKAIDRENGDERPIIGKHPNPAKSIYTQGEDELPESVPLTSAASAASAAWEGYGTAIKPSWEPIIIARKPLEGTVANNALKYGSGTLNIDGCRITPQNTDKMDTGCSPGGRGKGDDSSSSIGSSGSNVTGQSPMDLSSTTSTKTRETIDLKTSNSSNEENMGSITGKSISARNKNERPDDSSNSHATNEGSKTQNDTQTGNGENGNGKPVGRWPSNLILDGSDEVVGLFPKTSTHPGKWRKDWSGNIQPREVKYDSGSAARFFYSAKVSKRERDAGLEGFEEKSAISTSNGGREDAKMTVGGASLKGEPKEPEKVRNNHPTLKPISLTTYLAKLILPPKLDKPRRLLVPFAGSGSEVIGGYLAGWDEVVGVEREKEYCEIAEARIKHWNEEGGKHRQDTLFKD